ncbi:alpha-hydroxy acid oxidase [Alphaproteobacteria bacterium]|jgi:L-lactate dehydrogenase (cytochrome)|nr:alpha-hydroxy acid oxidase [Alphaproteobacteria bacterium]CAI8347371.1 MAG: L-lactate dehydrogenase [SAR116 cluster bacterium]
MAHNLMSKFPRIKDLEKVASKKIPPFIHAYLAAGTGSGNTMARNRRALDEITFTPELMHGHFTPNLETKILGQSYALPFGVAPIGLSSMIWPLSEHYLAEMAARLKIPYALSTVAGASIEDIGEKSKGYGWFQLYAPHNRDITFSLLDRAEKADMGVLVVTGDVPAPSRREDMRKAGAPIGSTNASRVTPKMLLQILQHPKWALAALELRGKLQFKNMERYAPKNSTQSVSNFIAGQLHGSLSWEYLAEIRKHWKGRLVLKGVLRPSDALRAIDSGVDSIIVSNHGGRQFDANPASISVLPSIRQAVGPNFPIIFDSGIRSGLDILKALAMGADFALVGRPFLYGIAAIGSQGGDHVAAILEDEISNALVQMGAKNIAELRQRLNH